MPGEDSWLLFKVSERDPLKFRKKALFSGVRGRTTLFISVPKKVVPLSTRRNRIRRLIREAVRQDAYFSTVGTLVEFKVTASPGEPGLEEVKAMLQKIKTQNSAKAS